MAQSARRPFSLATTEKEARPRGIGRAKTPRAVAQERPGGGVARAEETLALLASAALYTSCAIPAARWLVDDAGISYAYGINWGRHGQLAPNLEGWAVEGFSNPLTVAVVALLSVVRCFHPFRTPHGLAIAAFAVEGLFAFRLLRDGLRAERWVTWLALAVFLALEVCTPATMIWYGSGLENGQLSMAVVVMLRRLQVGTTTDFSPRADALLLALMATIRPEAPLFSGAWLVAAGLLLASEDAPGVAGAPARLRSLLHTAALTVGLLGAGLAVRYALFGSLFPNTFFAKVGKVDLAGNFAEYVRSSLGGYWYAFGLSFTAVGLFVSARLRPLAVSLVLFSCAALALPLVGGGDWMGHHRFATVFLMLGHLSFAGVCGAGWATAARERWVATVARAAPASVPAAFVLFLFAGGRDEYRAFLRSRYVGFALIADDEGFERVTIQRYLGLVYPVVALPDAGGSSVVGAMQLVDTAYLADYHMARIRADAKLVTQYELDERRVDLAEYHFWAFDKDLVGTKFLQAARFDADRDYPNFFPVYAARRDVVEADGPGAASEHLGGYGGIDAYLSDATVTVGAPGGVARVELMVAAQHGTWSGDCTVRVSVGDRFEERKVFTLSPLAEAPFTPAPDRYYRQGFLVPLPHAPADYRVRVRLCVERGSEVFEAQRPLSVRPAETLSLAELCERIGPRANGIEVARWVAQLREQLVPRLSPAERTRIDGAFRASYRDADRTDVDAYDTLLADSRPAFLEPMPEAVRELEGEASTSVAQEAARAWADPNEGMGLRTLAVGRRVDALRRLGFLGVARTEAWRPLLDEVFAAGGVEWTAVDPAETYARALGLALIFPETARNQKRLAEARVRGLALPDPDEATPSAPLRAVR
jgi:hypothetical protein